MLAHEGFAEKGIYVTDSAAYADEYNFKKGELRRKLVFCEAWIEDTESEVRNGASEA